MAVESENMRFMETVENIPEIQEFELSPLTFPPRDFGFSAERGEQFKKSKYERRSSIIPHAWKGPLKAFRLLVMVTLLPTLFLAVPLYIRYFVFSGQLYPVGMSDMRLIDKKMSTTWCQRQLLHSNATFNAFRTPSTPSISDELVPVTMTRQLYLQDDMKEYWGFYLLEGSVVTVSTCVRWPGASLIMIRGHKHLQECAYIGDDSSEELEELFKAGKLNNATIQKLINSSPSNRPNDMTRHLKGVQFHEPRPPALELNDPIYVPSSNSDEKDTPDAKVLQKILNHLSEKEDKKVSHPKPSYIVTVPQLTHRHRETNINQDEGKWLSFKDLETDDNNKVEDDKFPDQLENSQEPMKILEEKKTNEPENKSISKQETNENKPVKNPHENITAFQLKEVEKEIEWEFQEVMEEEQTSTEIFEDIFTKLSNLGVRGKNVLNKLNKKLAEEDKKSQVELATEKSKTSKENGESNQKSSELVDEDNAQKKIELLRQLLIEIIEDQHHAKKGSKANNARGKRELIIKQTLQKELNDVDEKGNTAIEDGFVPDGIADDHSVINETTKNDMSGSEFWSSFSSSEEALLECDGLILNLPLNPTKSCEPTDASKNDHDHVARSNTVTYRVPSNGYYFFVFNSENEIQTNYIRVKFDMQKTIYDLSKGTIVECENSTEKCAIPLSFFSKEKVVLEIPVRNNDSLWNEEFVVISECEPRTALYLLCVIAIPVVIILIAFQ